MARSKRKKGGIGAVGGALAKYFHPSAAIRAKWPNDYQKRRLENVIIVGKGLANINHRSQISYQCRIAEIDNNTVFNIVHSNFKVTAEGPTPFEDEVVQTVAGPPRAAVDPNANARSSTTNVAANVELTEDIAALRRQGITVDDDNEPAPENAVPQPAASGQVGEWVTLTTCPRRGDPNVQDREGQWINFRWSQIANMNELDTFRMCFPEQYVVDAVIPTTNKYIVGDHITLREFYVWLGCRFFMACFEGIPEARDWWSRKPVDEFEGAPFRLNKFMPGDRFRNITTAMRYTDKEVPSFEDKFHDVRQMIDAFNEHYAKNYSPSWLNCLDESMNPWQDKYAPGFMHVPRKPHPFGNEYHTIADGDGGNAICWRAKLQEGKDRPKNGNEWAFPSRFENHSNTVQLMLEMTEPIHHTGRVVSMDSGFCVAAGILAMHDHGVYGQSLIKKRRYWPKSVPGDQIDAHFASKSLGEVETLKQTIDGKSFYVHCTKDDRYVTKLMSTHGLMTTVEDHVTYRYVDGQWKSFKYTEPLSRHNTCKHWIDDVNNRRHDPIGLDDVWHTQWWPNRQFTFVCSVSEVNAVNSRARARNAPPEPQLEFRRQLAKHMLLNKIDDDGNCPKSPVRLRKRARESITDKHELTTRPTYTGAWNNLIHTWNKVKTEYCRVECAGCKIGTRTYCSCDMSVPLCQKCHTEHCIEVDRT